MTEQQRRQDVKIGPAFTLVQQMDLDELERMGGFQAWAMSSSSSSSSSREENRHHQPLLIKGAVKVWPAWKKWNFDTIADLVDAKQLNTKFQDGLIEQGTTKEPPRLPIAPYLRGLAQAAQEVQRETVDSKGLCPKQRYDSLRRQQQQQKDGNDNKEEDEEEFYLNWSHMQTFQANKLYLGEWHMLQHLPELRQDFNIRDIWPGNRCGRSIWEVVFIGPADTFTGLHYDYEDNWFFQIRGTKEFVLFDAGQEEYLCRSSRYDFGAVLSEIDLTRYFLSHDDVPRPNPRHAKFQQAKGQYVRVEAGDALFIPKGCWHSVVALEPSISLAVFGILPCEFAMNLFPYASRAILHSLGLYARGNCTCHQVKVADDASSPPGTAAMASNNKNSNHSKEETKKMVQP